MQRKIKILIYTLLFAVILSVFAALLFVMPHSISSVYAATSTSAEYITVGDVEKANGAFLFKGAPREFYSVIMESENVNGNGELENFSFINWSYIRIKVDAKEIKEHRKFTLNKNGEMYFTKELSGNCSEVLFEGKLDNGEYDFIFSTEYYVKENFHTISYYHFHFIVDILAPKYEIKCMDGILQNGEHTSKRISYSATDPHFQRLYYKSPNSNTFSSILETEYSVEPIASNSGWWQFYAIDSLGQKSETVKVYLDCIPPQMSLANKMNFGTTVCDSITVTATDDISSAKLYVKFESEEWFSSGNIYTIPNTERNGRYYFYAEDGNANRTETSWIVLSTEEPAGSLIKSDTDNSMSFVWNNEYWSATLDGKSYTEGRLISGEGQHEIVLSNNANKTKKYSFKIEHCYKVIERMAATCEENGLIKYECSQCGGRYEETDYTSGHKYVESKTPSTCTECEHITYTCNQCGDKYEKEGEYPTGHSYIETVTIEPTCKADGERKAVCELCGDEYTTKITANGHTYEITDTSTKDGKTTRIYTCNVCGESYKQELGNQYEEVSNYVEYLFEQYSPYMWWVLLASAGIWSIAIGVMTAIAQKNEDKEKAKKMLINYFIGLVVIAVIVVACPYLIRGIAALIT